MFLFFSALASYRILDKGEAHAFRSLYGADDMEKLIAIERDPVRFWREREEFLMAPGTTITHREFCKKFVQETKEHIAQNCAYSKGKASFRDGEVIDDAMHSIMCEGHPAWATVQAMFYGQACDRLSSRNLRHKEFSGLEKEMAELAHEMRATQDDFNDVHRWLASPCEEYPIVDNLIMHGKGLYLSSAVEPKGRCAFRAHPDGEKFLFSGWKGVIKHDTLAHALQQYHRALVLKAYGVSSTEHFKMYCGPAYIAQDDMITQSQQHLGWFYNVHELPSIREAYNPSALATVLFPYAVNLTDSGFAQIMPFFTRKAKSWKENTLAPDACTAGGLYQHAFLLKWRNTHCSGGWNVFPKEYFSSKDYRGYPGAEWVDYLLPNS